MQQLDEIRRQGAGFVFNDFTRGASAARDNVLHSADCRELAQMTSLTVPKEFFPKFTEAEQWLERAVGKEGERWRRCGTCHADGVPTTNLGFVGTGNPELLVAWEEQRDRHALRELQQRGVIEGEPATPVGQYARYMVVSTLGGRQVSAPESTHHIIDAQEQRLQVQARHIRDRDPTYYPLSLRPRSRDFDAVIAALYRQDYELDEAWFLPWDKVESAAVHSASAGWRLRVSGTWRRDGLAQPIDLLDPQGV